MSRELSPVEVRVCRMVFALLGAVVLAFAVLSTIDFVFDPWPRESNVQSQPLPRQLPPRIATPAAQLQKDSPQASLHDRPVGLGLLALAASKRAIRFDPGLLDRHLDNPSSFVAASSVPNLPPTETFQSGPQQQIFTTAFASAEPATGLPSEQPLADSPTSNSRGQPSNLSTDPASLSREDVRHIRSRLRNLGYLSSPGTDTWDAESRDALRDFKLSNRMVPTDKVDLETSEKLDSQTAVRADQSFIGKWSTAPCSSAKAEDVRVTISSRRVRSSTGSTCDLHDFQSDHAGWRVRAICSQRTQRWTADGRFALRGEKLIWTSDRDVISYFRCK